MHPIAKWTLWQRRSSIFWWAVGTMGFVVLSIGFYASFRGQADQLNSALDKIPPAAKSLVAGGNLNIISPDGFLNARLYYLMLPMLLSILAIGLGSSLVAREEDDGTLELLLSRPVSRARLLSGKAWAGFVILSFVGLSALAVTIITCELVKLYEPVANIILANFMTMLLALLFGTLAFCLTTIGRTRSASIGITVFVALGGYVVVSLAENVHWLKWPAKVFPYEYYRTGDILAGSFSWQNAAGYIAAILILGLISVTAFRRRDLNG
jgi:ABC-2 type transport system permease protein